MQTNLTTSSANFLTPLPLKQNACSRRQIYFSLQTQFLSLLAWFYASDFGHPHNTVASSGPSNS